VTYCDDGILYSEDSGELGKILQELFTLHNTGVELHSDKSGWVKKDNKWLKALKFVGLRYDPFEDVLSACTRKGSVLPMQLDVMGLLSKEASTTKDVVVEVTRDDDAKPDFSGCPFALSDSFLWNI
jgi:hypothetical protein